MPALTSLQNPLAKSYRRAAKGKLKGFFLVEGRHLLNEAIRARWPLESVLISKDLLPFWIEPLRNAALLTRTTETLPKIISALSSVEAPEGVMAIAARRETPWPKPVAGDFFLYLDAVQDPVNVGILVRSAEAFGLKGVFAGAGTADPFRLKALFRSAGAAFHVPIRSCTCESFLEWSNNMGLLLLGANARGISFYKMAPPQGPFVLVLGNEGKGLSPAMLQACKLRIAIPMAPNWDSLNVSAAGTLLLYALSGVGLPG